MNAVSHASSAGPISTSRGARPDHAAVDAAKDRSAFLAVAGIGLGAGQPERGTVMVVGIGRTLTIPEQIEHREQGVAGECLEGVELLAGGVDMGFGHGATFELCELGLRVYFVPVTSEKSLFDICD